MLTVPEHINQRFEHIMTIPTASSNPDRIAQIRAANNSSPQRRAGTELLIYTIGVDRGTWIDADGYIDPERMTHAQIGAYSSGEQRLLHLIASFLGGQPTDLNSDLSGLDQAVKGQIIAAVALALGFDDLATFMRL